jgi:hypothetical protein
MKTFHINASSLWETTFHLTKDGEERILGTLIYPKWYSYDARIELANNRNYTLEQTGFWGTTVALKSEHKELMNCQTNWKGHILIESHLEEDLTGYKVKNTFSLDGKVLLLDSDGQEAMAIVPDQRWYESVRRFKLTLSDKLSVHPEKELIMLTSIHCANRTMLSDG